MPLPARAAPLFVALLLFAACAPGPAPATVPDVDRPERPDATLPGVGDPEPPTASGPGVADLAPSGATERARVLRVVDGDTIVVDRGNGGERVRYIGVDTPESVRPDTPVEPMAREATAANEALVAGREVLLERDVSELDRFGRLLRYVWVEDTSSSARWTLVNLRLVADGFARVVTYPPDVRYVDLYLAAERDARERGAGLWADEAASP